MLYYCFSKSVQKAAKSPPKPFKILSKPRQNPSKTVPESSQNPPRTLLQNRTHYKLDFFNFFQFVESPRTPKIESKWQKIAKKCKKFEVKKTHVFHYNFFLILRCFGLRKRVPNQAFFTLFSKKAKLCKSLQNTAWAHEF